MKPSRFKSLSQRTFNSQPDRLARLLLATLDTAGQPASSVSVVAMVTIDAPSE